MNLQTRNLPPRFDFSTIPAGDDWYEYAVYRAGHKTVINGGVMKNLKAAYKAARVDIRKLAGMQ